MSVGLCFCQINNPAPLPQCCEAGTKWLRGMALELRRLSKCKTSMRLPVRQTGTPMSPVVQLLNIRQCLISFPTGNEKALGAEALSAWFNWTYSWLLDLGSNQGPTD